MPARRRRPNDVSAEELVVGLDTEHIRSSNRKQCRHHQVLVGYIERGSSRRAFASIQDETSAATLREHLDNMGYDASTTITAFTDGAEGLHSLPKKATGKSITPRLDWFHLAMRIQHLAQTASGFRTKTYNHERFKAKFVRAVERLRWRLWHGRRNGVRKTLNYLKRSLVNFRYRTQLEGCKHLNEGPGTFWSHLMALDSYVRTNALVIPNYHRRYHAGQRVSTALVESTVGQPKNEQTRSDALEYRRRGIRVACAHCA